MQPDFQSKELKHLKAVNMFSIISKLYVFIHVKFMGINITDTDRADKNAYVLKI